MNEMRTKIAAFSFTLIFFQERIKEYCGPSSLAGCHVVGGFLSRVSLCCGVLVYFAEFNSGTV